MVESVLPLKTAEIRGKKEVMVPREMTVPIQFKRQGSRAPSYFLCDNPQYCLGIENGSITDKSLRCFETFKNMHLAMLSDLDEPAAKAIIGFVQSVAFSTQRRWVADFLQTHWRQTVVYWAETAEPEYQSTFSAFLDGADNQISNEDLNAAMQAAAQGKAMDWACVPLNPDNKFYILGLAPNAARLSVRFFLQDTFGSFVRHLQEHYARLEIVKPALDPFETIPLWKLLGETVNQNSRDKSPSPQMAGDTLRAILTGGMYPATLYQQAQLRIHAEHAVSRGRAAIIKAFYFSQRLRCGTGKRGT